MRSRSCWPGLSLTLCLGMLGAIPARARQVSQQPASEHLQNAEVVALAIIESVISRSSRCDEFTELTLRPYRSLRGHLSPAMKTVPFRIAHMKGGPGCISASYTYPPAARTRVKGGKLVITIRFVEALKEYRATSTYELAEQSKIEAELRRLPPRPPSPQAAPAQAAPREPEEREPCRSLRSRFRTTLAAAPLSCSRDTTCAIYPGGLAGCGGVVDGPTARSLIKINDRFRRERCEYGINCAPRAITPICHQGRCQELTRWNRRKGPAAR